MFPKKSPIRGPLLIILIVISIFAFAYHSENKITGIVPAKVREVMVKVTGMDNMKEGLEKFAWEMVGVTHIEGT